MTTVAVYTRLSKDPTGEQTATARQEADVRKYCELRGWEVGPVFSDVDLSAFRRGVARPDYEAMLHTVAAGQVDGIVVWKLDRLIRRIAEFEKLWRICEDAGTFLASVNDSVDTSTATGRAMARIISVFAELESDTMSLRIKAQQAEAAAAGRKHAGGRKPFGLDATWSVIVEEEAAMLREAAAKVLDGVSLRSIVNAWNEAGIPAPSGGTWKTQSLRGLLLSPRLAGLRAYNGVVVAPGAWPAILDPETVEAVARVLTDPARLSRADTNRTYLVARHVHCGLCGKRLRPDIRSSGIPRYSCATKPDGCGRIAVHAAKLDDLIEEAVLLRVDSPELAAAMAERTGATTGHRELLDGIADAEARQAELATMWAEGSLETAAWTAARERLDAILVDLRSHAAKRRRSSALDGFAGRPGALRAAWPTMLLEQRRAVLAVLIDRIMVAPAVRGRNWFDPDRVDVTWVV